jgi:multiple sugar transport system permease protein
MKSTRRRTETVFGYIFIGPWLIGFLGLILIPMGATLLLSFTKYDLFTPPEWVGLQNLRTMFTSDSRYWNSVGVTLYFSFVSVPLKLIFALMIAMVLNTRRKMVEFYRAVYYAPSVIGTSVAVAVMWREIFGRRGLINAVIELLGGTGEIAWLGNPGTAIWTLILLVVWQFGSPMLVFLAGLKQIPDELYESGDIDGAGPVAKFLHITLPMLTPVFLFNLVMQIIFGFTVFTQAFIITNGGPMDRTNFYALYLYRKAFEDFQMGYGSAMAMILLVTIATVTAMIFKSSPYWVHYESE